MSLAPLTALGLLFYFRPRIKKAMFCKDAYINCQKEIDFDLHKYQKLMRKCEADNK